MINRITKTKKISLASVLACVALLPFFAVASDIVPDNQQAVLMLQGQGVSPYAEVSLSTGPQQKIMAKADKNGNFVFSNLKYTSFNDLKFLLNIPSYQNGLANHYPSNTIEFSYNPQEALAKISGQIGESGTIAFHLDGADDSRLEVAGPTGYVTLQERTHQKISTGSSKIVASIVNVGEVCCPRIKIPAMPVTLTLLSSPFANTATPKSQKSPSVPVDTPPQKKSTPESVKPLPLFPQKQDDKQDNKQDSQPDEKPKKKIPYIVQGSIEEDVIVISHDEVTAAGVSYPANTYDNTYVGGIKKMTDEVRNAILLNAAAIGAMMDGRNLMDTLRALQVSTVKTLKNYTASDSVCQFGTLSRSLSAADAVAHKNQLAFGKILMDRDIQKKETIYSNAGVGIFTLLKEFQDKYCDPSDNNGMKKYCKAATATSDLLYNRDVDFTRVFDIPLTINADFADNAPTDDKQSVIALFHNLTLVPPLMRNDATYFDPQYNTLTTQDSRAINAVRTVTGNSFAALVSEKVKTTSASTAHMTAILTQLGLSAADATKLIGANPSYFAQMEVMTKKIFQNPAFYANLYDSEANVDRQRVAMKAIELQQDRDFLESLRRREILLSVLLNTKLKNKADRANESGIMGR